MGVPPNHPFYFRMLHYNYNPSNHPVHYKPIQLWQEKQSKSSTLIHLMIFHGKPSMFDHFWGIPHFAGSPPHHDLRKWSLTTSAVLWWPSTSQAADGWKSWWSVRGFSENMGKTWDNAWKIMIDHWKSFDVGWFSAFLCPKSLRKHISWRDRHD